MPIESFFDPPFMKKARHAENGTGFAGELAVAVDGRFGVSRPKLMDQFRQRNKLRLREVILRAFPILRETADQAHTDGPCVMVQAVCSDHVLIPAFLDRFVAADHSVIPDTCLKQKSCHI